MLLLRVYYWISLTAGAVFLVWAVFELVRLRTIVREVIIRKYGNLSLERVASNPVLRPGTYTWQSEAVLNPAALVLDGRTHLIYRSIGEDGVSRLGYASSPDGISFDYQLPYPVYLAQPPRKTPLSKRRYAPIMYPSGGSWGGCEDPRMVAIDDKIHITFNMFDGWDNIRVAHTSISKQSFLKKHFWELRPFQFLSPPKQRHKNWALFPEKINGKYAILHSVSPSIEIEYRDSIDAIGTDEPFISSWEGSRDSVSVRKGFWDNRVRSAGPPPLKTEHGWLLFYHANDAAEAYRYKLGAMLLDPSDPTRILYRSSAPILEPDAAYENDGKPGIVYACGATIQNDMINVYYGGADKVICVAFAKLAPFLADLMTKEHQITE